MIHTFIEKDLPPSPPLPSYSTQTLHDGLSSFSPQATRQLATQAKNRLPRTLAKNMSACAQNLET